MGITRIMWVLVAVGCGAKTEAPAVDASTDAPVADGSPRDTSAVDAAPITCADPSGGMPTSLKTCSSDADCATRSRRSDCCGSEMVVGVRADVADAFAACETERQKGLPVCDCLTQPTRAEDGRETSGFTVKVSCTDFTSSGGICKTHVE